MAWRSTQRTDPSQPPDYRTYSPEVTSSRSNLPVHRIAAMGILFPRGPPYNIRNSSQCQENFLTFLYFFQVFSKVIPIPGHVLFLFHCAIVFLYFYAFFIQKRYHFLWVTFLQPQEKGGQKPSFLFDTLFTHFHTIFSRILPCFLTALK